MKILYGFVLLFLSVCIGYAQIDVGGKVGVNVSNISVNQPNGNEQSGIGLHVAAIGSIGIGKSGNLFGVGELALNQKGGYNDQSGKSTLTFLELPLMLRYAFWLKDGLPLRFFMNAGPYFGVMAGKSVTQPDIKTAKMDDYNYSAVEIGLTAGGGVMIKAGPGRVFVEARYSFALNNMIPEMLQRNYFSTFAIGYLYPLQGKTQEEKDKTVKDGFE